MIILKEAKTTQEANKDVEKLVDRYYIILSDSIKESLEKSINKISSMVEKETSKLYISELKDLKKENPDYDISYEVSHYSKFEDSSYYLPTMRKLLVKLSDNIDGDVNKVLIKIHKDMGD